MCLHVIQWMPCLTMVVSNQSRPVFHLNGLVLVALSKVFSIWKTLYPAAYSNVEGVNVAALGFTYPICESAQGLLVGTNSVVGLVSHSVAAEHHKELLQCFLVCLIEI